MNRTLTQFQTSSLQVLTLASLLSVLSYQAAAATLGTVIPIGGHAADIVLDENRRNLYIANYTGNRIDVLSTDTNTIARSIVVSAQPSALALSPDGKYLVVAHYSALAPSSNAVTVLNLADNSRRVFGVGSPVLGLAFGVDDQAFLITPDQFLSLDPASGQTRTVDTVGNLIARSLPIPILDSPPTIAKASMTASRDGLWIYGLADKFTFRYDVQLRQLIIANFSTLSEFGPRTVSVTPNGSHFVAGGSLFDKRGTLLAQFTNTASRQEVGSHVFDPEGGLIYAQVAGTDSTGKPVSHSSSPNATPLLQIVSAENLAVLERVRIRENLSGRAVMNSGRDTIYAASDSGITILPIGPRTKALRVKFDREDILFRGNACSPQQQTLDVKVEEASGGQAAFRLIASGPGVRVSPNTGVTPAVVRVTIDPGEFANAKGTSVGYINLLASSAINVPQTDLLGVVETDRGKGLLTTDQAIDVTDRLRVLVNNRDSDQRGSVTNISGTLVDVLSDPVRGQFYVVRQNTNEVLVFDKTLRQVAALRTGNTPTQMSMSPDSRYLVVGNGNSQIASVFDLDTLQASTPIGFPPGHYPRSIATVGGSMFASVRSTSGRHTIDRIDIRTRTAFTLKSLGVFDNDIDENTVLASSPDGSMMLIAMANGKLLRYDGGTDSFTARKDFEKLSGAYAVLNDGPFLVDNHILNASLAPIGLLEQGSDASSGLLAVDRSALRTRTPGSAQAGKIERIDVSQGVGILPTRTTESPLTPPEGRGFTRTLAVLGNREGLISLTTSGFTVLPWNYDASYAPPKIDRVFNAADVSDNIAPGSLLYIVGSQFCPT